MSEHEQQWLHKAAALQLTHNAFYVCDCGTKWRQFVPADFQYSTCPRCGNLIKPQQITKIGASYNSRQ
jgi:DNA-directed RNA polymerase subunit M/transcription elongation factor TFIIS